MALEAALTAGTPGFNACEACKEVSRSGGTLADVNTISSVCTGNGLAGMVMVNQCVSTGMDKEASSTRVHDVICTCGFLTRRILKPIHTAPPRSRERSA